jgi:RNA recognition motif-containing protein
LCVWVVAARAEYQDGGYFIKCRIVSGEDMESKLYVGNLPYSTTEEDLRVLFSQAGTVSSVSIVTDRDSGQSKGFAFVEMGNQSEAENAIQMFNGYSMQNRTLRVDIARPREERRGGGGGYGDYRGGGGGYGGGGRGRGGQGKRQRQGGDRGSRGY